MPTGELILSGRYFFYSSGKSNNTFSPDIKFSAACRFLASRLLIFLFAFTYGHHSGGCSSGLTSIELISISLSKLSNDSMLQMYVLLSMHRILEHLAQVSGTFNTSIFCHTPFLFLYQSESFPLRHPSLIIAIGTSTISSAKSAGHVPVFSSVYPPS